MAGFTRPTRLMVIILMTSSGGLFIQKSMDSTSPSSHRLPPDRWALTADTGSDETLIPGQAPNWVPDHPETPAPATMPLPPVLSAVNSDASAVVTPAEAKQIVAVLWSLRNEAFLNHSAALMAEFESGPALESDEVTCGCTTRLPRGPIYGESLLIPRVRSFPAVFLAEVKTTLLGKPYVQYLIVARTSTSSPWMVASDPGEQASRTLDQAKTDAVGFDIATSPPGSALLPSELAAYYQTWTNTGRALNSVRFASGPYTTGAGRDFGKYPQGTFVKKTGLTFWSLDEAGSQVWSFGTTTGSITCGVVRNQTIQTSPTGIYQDPAQNNWGPSVAPGGYRMVATTDIAQPCFLQRAHGAPAVTSGSFDPDTEQGISPISFQSPSLT